MLLLIKFFAYSASKFSKKDAPHTTDIYITHSTPNIFLWINCISFQADIVYIGFWASIAFFVGILLDEIYFVYKFNGTMSSKKNRITHVKPARVSSTIRQESCPVPA